MNGAEILKIPVQFLQPTEQFQLPFMHRDEILQGAVEGAPLLLPSTLLVTFPATTDFGKKQAERIANGNHVIAGLSAASHKCEQVAKQPKCGHVTTGKGERHV